MKAKSSPFDKIRSTFITRHSVEQSFDRPLLEKEKFERICKTSGIRQLNQHILLQISCCSAPTPPPAHPPPDPMNSSRKNSLLQATSEGPRHTVGRRIPGSSNQGRSGRGSRGVVRSSRPQIVAKWSLCGPKAPAESESPPARKRCKQGGNTAQVLERGKTEPRAQCVREAKSFLLPGQPGLLHCLLQATHEWNSLTWKTFLVERRDWQEATTTTTTGTSRIAS